MHWADQAAQRILKEKGDRETYTVAAGITPSGTIHIGNFREIITAELVARALESLGRKARFIYSWDDFDVFRKVPENMPEKELLEKQLRMPITEVPDTLGCSHSSYADHNEKILEQSLPEVGISPEFIRQSERYRNCDYAEEIDLCLQKASEIRQVLDRYRKEPLAEDWLPVSIFCEECHKDTIEKIEYKGRYIVRYSCSCGHSDEFDIRKKGIIKLNWRVDWPMRWHHEKVDCEPAGKDHYAAGGSVQSGREILKTVWNEDPPVGFPFEWIGIKGGGQFSSSAGIIITLAEMLEVYEPEIVRFLFAGARPNTEFSISFDLDVIKLYEDFDRLERAYFGKEDIGEKKLAKLKRIYELSCTGIVPGEMPFQPSFRHLTNVILAYSYDMDRVASFYSLKKKQDKQRLLRRAGCARNWLERYAPEDFRFTIRMPGKMDLPKKMKALFMKLSGELLEKDWDEKGLTARFYDIAKESGLEPAEFFETAYQILIAKKKGPKLAGFVLTIGRERAAEIFSKI